MSDLTKALKEYCEQHKAKSTLTGFAQIDGHKKMIATWFEIYTDYKEATAVLKRKFCQVYKDTTGKTHRTSTVPDLTPPQFELSKTQKEALKKGAEILNQACNVQSDIISSNLRDAQR
ncbi:hypothetical protein G6F56_006340 [Rhizopus delemar]|nr:hypothetical protein G6F56_006340 [Rhizopus delemar]